VTADSETFAAALHAIYHSTSPDDAADRGRAAPDRRGAAQVGADGSGEGGQSDATESGAEAEGRRASCFKQFVRLVEWSRTHRRFDVSRLAAERDRGGEHAVYNAIEGPQLLFKVTHPGHAGLTVVTHRNRRGEFNSAIGSATPVDYFERMIIANEVFGDGIRFEGIIEGDQSSIVISQPKVEGSMPEQPEITVHLRDRLGFDRVDTLIWYRPSDGLVIGDTKRSNFIQTPDGQIVPIDIAACLASAEMAESWGYPLPPESLLRKRLEGLRVE
jgi:hypothetical protein